MNPFDIDWTKPLPPRQSQGADPDAGPPPLDAPAVVHVCEVPTAADLYGAGVGFGASGFLESVTKQLPHPGSAIGQLASSAVGYAGRSDAVVAGDGKGPWVPRDPNRAADRVEADRLNRLHGTGYGPGYFVPADPTTVYGCGAVNAVVDGRLDVRVICASGCAVSQLSREEAQSRMMDQLHRTPGFTKSVAVTEPATYATLKKDDRLRLFDLEMRMSLEERKLLNDARNGYFPNGNCGDSDWNPRTCYADWLERDNRALAARMVREGWLPGD